MSEARVFFSIIVPTYNRGALLMESINSVLVQRNVSLEVIVVDDGSTDNTEELVRKIGDERVRYLKVANGERGAARNRGREIAWGRYINYFDSDDIYYDSLHQIWAHIERQKFPPAVFGSIDAFHDNDRIVRSQGRPYASIKDNLLFNNFLACGSVFLDARVASEFLFSEDRALSGSEDWELWLRVFARYDFIEMPVAVFKQREHNDRSMRENDGLKIMTREMAFVKCIEANRALLRKRFTNSEIQRLIADRYTLIALCLHVSKSKVRALHFWMKSFAASPRVVLRKRFWAVAKKLVFFGVW